MLEQIKKVFGGLLNFIIKVFATIALIYTIMLMTGYGMGTEYEVYVWWNGLPIVKIIGLILFSGFLLVISSKKESPKSVQKKNKTKRV